MNFTNMEEAFEDICEKQNIPKEVQQNIKGIFMAGADYAFALIDNSMRKAAYGIPQPEEKDEDK